MYIDFLPDGTGRTVLRAHRGAADQPLPVSELVFDTPPATADPDRIAVAGALVFAGFAERSLGFAKPISAEVAEAITAETGLVIDSEVLRKRERDADSVEQEERARRPRVTTLSVSLGLQSIGTTPGIDCTRLALVPGERYSGALFGVKEMLIGSNAWLLATYLEPSVVMTASGVLFADDLFAGTIAVERGESAAWPTARARGLCESIGLALS